MENTVVKSFSCQFSTLQKMIFSVRFDICYSTDSNFFGRFAAFVVFLLQGTENLEPRQTPQRQLDVFDAFTFSQHGATQGKTKATLIPSCNFLYTCARLPTKRGIFTSTSHVRVLKWHLN